MRDRVSELIKDAMLSGRLKSGERIVELKLAKELGLATTSIREALFELEGQGFVTRIANKGAFVSELSENDIEQIYQVRTELEGLAVTLFKAVGNPQDFALLQDKVDLMKAHAQEGDRAGFYRRDLELHQTLWQLSGNRFLSRCLDNIVPPLFAFYIHTLERTPTQLLHDAERHQEMLTTIQNESPSAARKALESALVQVFWAVEPVSAKPRSKE